MHNNSFARKGLLLALLIFMPAIAWASTASGEMLDLTATNYGIIALIVFVIACTLVIGEEFLHLRKSKPLIVAAGIT